MIRELIAGDHDVFTTFYKEYLSRVYAFFYTKTRSEADSKDLTQQTFIKFWQYRSSLSETLPAEVQLFQKARQLFIDWLRKQASQRQAMIEILQDQEPVQQPFVQEKVQLIKKASESLSEKQKKVFDLHYLNGYTYKEIAGFLNISTRTVDAHLYSALKQIRKLI